MKIDENNNDKAILIFRFSEKKWIDCFLEGRLSFSCAGAYISQGLTTSNNEQGDPYEAVFARLMRDDSRIFQAKQQLGDDLEVIEDGDYVMLRRHSAKLVPIFCFFCYLQKDLFNEGKLEYVVNNQGKIKLEFDENMYKGFVDGNKKTNCEPTVATIVSAQYYPV